MLTGKEQTLAAESRLLTEQSRDHMVLGNHKIWKGHNLLPSRGFSLPRSDPALTDCHGWTETLGGVGYGPLLVIWLKTNVYSNMQHVHLDKSGNHTGNASSHVCKSYKKDSVKHTWYEAFRAPACSINIPALLPGSEGRAPGRRLPSQPVNCFWHW